MLLFDLHDLSLGDIRPWGTGGDMILLVYHSTDGASSLKYKGVDYNMYIPQPGR